MTTRLVLQLPTPEVVFTFPSNYIDAMVSWLNFARQQPARFADVVEMYRQRYREIGKEAELNEAIAFLRARPPCTTTIRHEPFIARAAQDWVNEQGPMGTIGHGDPFQRIMRYGTYRSAGETIEYGGGILGPIRFGEENKIVQPRDVLVDLIVDADVPNRGHRQIIYTCAFDQVGIGFGRHNSILKVMTVMDFARGFTPRT